MAIKPITVSQFNNYVKRILETDPLLGNVTIIGEISNLKFHGSGNVFFTLKDETSRLSCFLSRDNFSNLRYEINDGMMIKASGYVSVYGKNGTYSFNIKDIELEGLGSLAVAFEALKNKLDKEGLFDAKHKKSLPEFPKQIAIITSETGAAVRDIIEIIKTKNKMVRLVVVPSLVQGPLAADELSLSIKEVNENLPETDLIIIGRGGGSLEELWAFNEEKLVRAIFNSSIPIISAVGHETDFSLSDFVADRRGATPTDAANMAVPNITELLEKSSELLIEMYNSVKYKIELQHTKINLMKKELKALSPLNIMSRGYTLMTDSDGGLVKDISLLEKGDLLTLIHTNGKIIASVEKVLEEADGKRKA